MSKVTAGQPGRGRSLAEAVQQVQLGRAGQPRGAETAGRFDAGIRQHADEDDFLAPTV